MILVIEIIPSILFEYTTEIEISCHFDLIGIDTEMKQLNQQINYI